MTALRCGAATLLVLASVALATANSQDVVSCGGFVEASSQLSQCVIVSQALS